MPVGTVLFSSRAPIGYIAILSQAAATNQGFKSFVPSSAVLSEFAYLWLKFRAPAIDAVAPSTTFREVNGKAMLAQPLPIPPLGEQRRIVEVADRILMLVRDLRRRLAA